MALFTLPTSDIKEVVGMENSRKMDHYLGKNGLKFFERVCCACIYVYIMYVCAKILSHSFIHKNGPENLTLFVI